MDSLVRPVVKLQRYRIGIKCPGCAQLFDVDDECAEHLLNKCIQFRSNDDYESRQNLASWIIEYFKTTSYEDRNPPDAVKINLLLNDDRISNSMKASLRVNIPERLSSICCPICCEFSFTAEACLEHLFSKCLFVKNNETLRVRDWLCEYFSTKTEKNLKLVRDMLSNYSLSPIMCKYCKTEAPDQDSLTKHFPCSQRRITEPSELMCEICNFSVPNWQRLMNHLISKHYQCHACRKWPRSNEIGFIAFKNHLKYCNPGRPIFFRCPMCLIDVPVAVIDNLKSHLKNCKRERAERAFNSISLFGKCDIINCNDQILLCDVDAHVTKHLNNRDLPSGRQKLRISAEDLNNLIMNTFSERESTFCICNGSLS